jgi:hypothetical protein
VDCWWFDLSDFGGFWGKSPQLRTGGGVDLCLLQNKGISFGKYRKLILALSQLFQGCVTNLQGF